MRHQPETALASSRLRPIRLRRPVAAQPSEAERRRRRWTDHALIATELALITVLLGYGGLRIANAAMRAPAPPTVARPVALHPTAQAPRPAATPKDAPKAALSASVRRTTQAERPSPLMEPKHRARHPELGDSLPSVGPRPAAPAQSADYLRPALEFIPGAPPTPEPVVAPAPPAPARDLRPVHLTAPRAKIDTPVDEVFLQNGVWQVADHAAGYLHGTGVNGGGNMVIAGHKGLGSAVFARLEELKAGDEVFVDADGERFRYRVRATGSVWPWAVEIMYPTTTPTLTLLTCTNWDTQRFVVIADLVDSAAHASGG